MRVCFAFFAVANLAAAFYAAPIRSATCSSTNDHHLGSGERTRDGDHLTLLSLLARFGTFFEDVQSVDLDAVIFGNAFKTTRSCRDPSLPALLHCRLS